MSDAPTQPAAAPAVRLRDVVKTFGDVRAVDGVNLEVPDGEFLSLLGPSGSGKTTVLRLIAGFEQADSGTIELAGRDVAGTPPYERDVNTVFQDYALFPHMSVQENIEYGLRVKKVAKAERRSRALEALEQVQLPGMGSRKPSQLSGGQRQRVALARALVNRPRVLLLDEPLGALDLKLRRQMQTELKDIQVEVGITFIFVTHDQEEALTMSDRIAVFDAGRIVQLGTPMEVYTRPATEFVAGFVGTTNILSGAVAQAVTGRDAVIAIRPEHITIAGDAATAAGMRTVEATIHSSVYLGATTDVTVTVSSGQRLTVSLPNTSSAMVPPSAGQSVWCRWRTDDEFVIAPR